LQTFHNSPDNSINNSAACLACPGMFLLLTKCSRNMAWRASHATLLSCQAW